MNLLENIDMLDKQMFEWGEISWLQEPIGSQYRRLSVAQVKIYPGRRQEKHFHLGEEQLFYVLQGQGSFITDGEKENINESMAVYIPPYSEHEVLNTGDENLIFIVVYVPVKLIQLQKPYTISTFKNLQDVISVEILNNIRKQLSELLKLTIHIYDANHQLLTSDDEKSEFCKICSSIHPCNKRRYVNESAHQLSDKMNKCEYDLIELEIPITLNDNVYGYIKSGSFTLNNSREIDEKIKEMGVESDIDHDLIVASYKKIPDIIKSRIYVIEEHLAIAAQFIQIMLVRSIFEQELTEKDNEILANTKEKIMLKDALKKANEKIYNNRIFSGGSDISKEIMYPYGLELDLESAIKGLDIGKAEECINEYRNICTDCKSIVQEMIIVLSRTALRGLEDLEIISHMRKKYDKQMDQVKKEDPWEVLKCFCADCIGEYEKVMQSNGRELIDNINAYIKAHYMEDINLNLIANTFFISPNYLSSLFNDKNHMSFSDYVQNLRIAEAKRYLITTRMKINYIGNKVGYKNNSYFVNIFKKNVGMTPNKYRKKLVE